MKKLLLGVVLVALSHGFANAAFDLSVTEVSPFGTDRGAPRRA